MTAAGEPVSLVGSAVELRPVTHAVAARLLAGDRSAVEAAGDYPHADTLDALGPLVAAGDPAAAGSWFVVRRADGLVVGDCGVRGAPDAGGAVEIGYGLAPSARGSGLGAEAVALLCAWLAVQEGVRVVVADVLADNTASRRLLERLGFTPASTSPPHVRYSRPLPPPAPSRSV